MKPRVLLHAVALLLAASSALSLSVDDYVKVYETWSSDRPIKYVNNFDQPNRHKYTQHAPEVERQRRKREVGFEPVEFADNILPIARTCEMPGYTGQFCEFPLCDARSDDVDPTEYLTQEGVYMVDVGPLGKCDSLYTTIIDEALTEIRVEVKANDRVNPRIALVNAAGQTMNFTEEHISSTVYVAVYQDIPPGTYLARPRADNKLADCTLLIMGITGLTISGGFVSDYDVDQARIDIHRNTAVNGTFNTIVLHANANPSPGSLKTVQIIGQNNLAMRNQLLTPRFHCSYEYFFDAFYCPAEGDYNMIVEGVDSNGYLFRRTLQFHCFDEPRPAQTTITPPTPEPTNPTTCNGHGVLVRRQAGAGTYCVCDDLWTGFDCERAVCMNGGTPIKDQTECACEPGVYSGLHCEDITCDGKSRTNFNTDSTAVNLVFRLRTRMSDVLTEVTVALGRFVRDMQFDTETISGYNLVLFNNGQILLVDQYSTINDMVAALQAANATATSDGGCTDFVWSALATALARINSNKSPVYVVTDALPETADDEGLTDSIVWEAFFKAPLYFFYVMPVRTDFCSPEVTAPAFRLMDNFAARTSGMALFIDNRTNVQEALYQQIRATFYHTQLMLSADRQFCNVGQQQHTVQVDALVDSLVILAKGTNLGLNVIAPSGTQLQAVPTYQSGDFYIFKVNGPAMGQYFINVNSTPSESPCVFRVYQGSVLNTNSKTKPELFYAFSNEINVDGPLPIPVVGVMASPVFYLSNYNVRPDKIFTSLSIYTYRQDREVEIYTSNGLWRDGCTYNFYFPPLTCRNLDDVFHFNFYARDLRGYYIQRASSFSCLPAPPLPPVNPTSCQNGGAPFPGTNTTACICPPGFSGHYCEVIDCANGGTSGPVRCSCPPGFTGIFCEIVTCRASGPTPNYGTNGVDMIFVVELTQRGQTMIASLNRMFGDLLRDLGSQSPTWINRIVLSAYNSTWSGILADDPYSDYSNVLQTMNTLATQGVTDQQCVVRTWEALNTLTSINGRNSTRRRSIINVFQASIPDNRGDAIEAQAVVTALREQQHLLNVFQAYSHLDNGQYFCNANQSDFALMEAVARRTEGRLYVMYASSSARASFMIPTFYSSSVVYRREFTDCVTAPQSIYYPIDAHTQTISVIVRGNAPAITTKKALNSTDLTPLTQVIVDDPGAGWVVQEIRKVCDDEWESQGQSCMRFNTDQNNWQNAKAECVGFNGYITDDLSQDKDNFLNRKSGNMKFWLGLFMQDDGTWAFDYGDAGSQAVTTAFWQGGVTPTDRTRACAYFDPTSTTGHWVADDCNAQYLTVCQKHLYDDNSRPSRIDGADVSPGKYTTTVQTETPAQDFDYGTGCMIEIRVQSSILIDSGFNTDVHGDFPARVASINSRENHIVTSLTVPTNVDTASISHALLYAFDDSTSTLLEAATFSRRARCNYVWVSQTITCEETGGNDFTVLHVGEDDTGATFQRLSTGICETTVTFCANGGIVYRDACVCPDYFTGVTCATPVCQNGGTLGDTGRRCNCAPGFTGLACELAMCTDPTAGTATFSNDYKSLVILIEETVNNRDSFTQVAQGIDVIVANATQGRPNWFTNYILHTFSSTNPDLSSTSYTDVTTFQAGLNTRLGLIADQGACNLPLYEALAALLSKGYSLDGSPILLITAGAPTDESFGSLILTSELFGTHSPRVNYIYTVGDAFNDCGGIVFNGPNFDLFYQQIVLPTMGVLVKENPSTLAGALQTFLPTRYGSTPISQPHLDVCQEDIEFLQIDVNMTDIWILLTSEGPLSITVFDTDRNPSHPLAVISHDHQRLYNYKPRRAGFYKLQINPGPTTTNCYGSVYGQGGVQVIFGFVQVSPEFPDGIHSDDARPFAISGAINVPVFHIVDPDDSDFVRGTLFYSQMVAEDTVHLTFRPYLSELRPRVGCSYSYYGNPFECPEDDAIFIQASGQDTLRQLFSRGIKTWCTPTNGTRIITTAASTLSTSPSTVATGAPVQTTSTSRGPVQSTASTTPPTTTSPPPLTPDQIQFDIFFLVDLSEDSPDFFFQQEEPWIEQVLAPYTIDTTHVHAGLVNLPGSLLPRPRTYIQTYLSQVATKADYFRQLMDIGQPLEQGGLYQPGSPEYILDALTKVNTVGITKPNGYRTDNGFNNHVLIIITGTNTIDNIEQVVAAAMTTRQYFGVITVGIGNVDQASLQRISNGAACTFIANNQADLDQAKTGIQNLIYQAYLTTNGVYC